MAGSWLMASVFIDRINVRSPAIFAVWGNNSLMVMRPGPYSANLYFDAASGKRLCPALMPVSRCPLRTDAGKSCPHIVSSLGL